MCCGGREGRRRGEGEGEEQSVSKGCLPAGEEVLGFVYRRRGLQAEGGPRQCGAGVWCAWCEGREEGRRQKEERRKKREKRKPGGGAGGGKERATTVMMKRCPITQLCLCI